MATWEDEEIIDCVLWDQVQTQLDVNRVIKSPFHQRQGAQSFGRIVIGSDQIDIHLDLYGLRGAITIHRTNGIDPGQIGEDAYENGKLGIAG